MFNENKGIMKRVLITGIGGFLAHHTMEHLLINTDWEIVGIDSWGHKGISERVIDSEHYKANRDRVTIFTHDLTAPISEILKNRIGHIDYILAIASQSHVDRSITDPVPFIKNNIDLILNTLEYAREVKPEKFLLISTDEVYGPITEGGHPEWDSIIPSNPYCLHPDSLVLTSRGYKRIEDINVMEDLIYGSKRLSNTHPTKYQPLNKFVYDYKGKMLRVKTRTQEIVCTPEHRLFNMETFFTEGKPMMQFSKDEPTTRHPHIRVVEKRAKDLVVNDKIAVVKKIQGVNEKEFNNDFCRFLGYFLGDGSYSERSKYIRLADQKKEYLEHYSQILENYLGVSKKSRTGNFGNIYKHGTKDCWYLQFACEQLRHNINLKDKSKLADYMFNASEENIASFVGGFFDAEAHYRYEEDLLVSISSFQANKETLIQIQGLLLRLGIVSQITLDREGQRLNITNADSLDKCRNIPCFKWRENTTLRKSQGSNSKNKFVRWDNIVSIEEFDYEGKVYDLEMPHGNYVAQGMIVHNSASKSAQEDISVSYWRTYGLPLILTNCMNLIGERQDPEKYLPMCIKKIANDETISVHSQNGQIGTRFYLHARNFSDAMLFLLNNITPAKYPDADRPDRFNIVGKTELNNLELAQKVADIMGKELKYELVDVHSTRPGHDLRYGLDGSKLAALGYDFPVSFDDSLRTTVEWHMKRENEEWRRLR